MKIDIMSRIFMLLCALLLVSPLSKNVKAGGSTAPTKSPTITPTFSPTNAPSLILVSSPTKSPTSSPTLSPTKLPTSSPTLSPTKLPTSSPTFSPTNAPSLILVSSPTKSPTSSPTLLPTKLPTSSPTLSPTKLPTSSPTLSPTKAPTLSPTLSPTKLPTFSPTFTPTFSPTFSPTNSPGTPTAPPFPPGFASDSYDLYLLADLSGSTGDLKKVCQKVTPISGSGITEFTDCWHLYVSTAKYIVDAMTPFFGLYNPQSPPTQCGQNPNCGLRIMFLGFSCSGGQSTPVSIPFLPTLTSDQAAIDAAFADAFSRKPEGGTCPDEALEKILMEIENSFPLVQSRPGRGLVVFSDAFLYNGNKYSRRTRNAIQAIRTRCAQTFVLPAQIGSSFMTAKEKAFQISQLKLLGGSASNFAEVEEGLQKGFIQYIQRTKIDLVKALNNPKCLDPTLYQTAPSRYCQYGDPGLCASRIGCAWNKGCKPSGCQGYSAANCLKDPKCTLNKKKKCVLK